MVFDNGKVVYAENEKSPGEVSVRSLPFKSFNFANPSSGIRRRGSPCEALERFHLIILPHVMLTVHATSL